LRDGDGGYFFTQLLDRKKSFSNEYFWFIPWGGLGPPRLILNHLGEINSYLQDLSSKN